MSDNFWLGNNELVIINRDGTHHVIEKYEDWEPVFSGKYEACRSYCVEREREYYSDPF